MTAIETMRFRLLPGVDSMRRIASAEMVMDVEQGLDFRKTRMDAFEGLRRGESPRR